jgi:hypothetical protein
LNLFGGPESYPRTRSSHALAMNGVKMVLGGRLRSSMSFGYRYFFDSWDISAHTFNLGYSQRLSDGVMMDLRFRYYDQTRAAFFQDNFTQVFNFMARDKELSTFTDLSLGAKFSYAIKKPFQFLDRASVNVAFDLIRFDYEDFRDYTVDAVNGRPFNFDAEVIQLFFSVWY